MSQNSSADNAELPVAPIQAAVPAGADEESQLGNVPPAALGELSGPPAQTAEPGELPGASPEIAESAVPLKPDGASSEAAEPIAALDPAGASADTAEPPAGSDNEMPRANEPPATTVSLALSEPPQLVADEDPLAYEDMLARMSLAVKPEDFIEEVWVREVVDMTWEIERLRRQKTGHLVSCTPDGLAALLSSYFCLENAKTLSSDWAWGKPEAVKYVKKILADAGMSIDAVMGRALALKIDEFERINHMIMEIQAGRNAELREIHRHRATLGERLRRAVGQVEDAEFKVVEPDPDGSPT
jgi:hypothetical protein